MSQASSVKAHVAQPDVIPAAGEVEAVIDIDTGVQAVDDNNTVPEMPKTSHMHTHEEESPWRNPAPTSLLERSQLFFCEIYPKWCGLSLLLLTLLWLWSINGVKPKCDKDAAASFWWYTLDFETYWIAGAGYAIVGVNVVGTWHTLKWSDAEAILYTIRNGTMITILQSFFVALGLWAYYLRGENFGQDPPGYLHMYASKVLSFPAVNIVIIVVAVQLIFLMRDRVPRSDGEHHFIGFLLWLRRCNVLTVCFLPAWAVAWITVETFANMAVPFSDWTADWPWYVRMVTDTVYVSAFSNIGLGGCRWLMSKFVQFAFLRDFGERQQELWRKRKANETFDNEECKAIECQLLVVDRINLIFDWLIEVYRWQFGRFIFLELSPIALLLTLAKDFFYAIFNFGLKFSQDYAVQLLNATESIKHHDYQEYVANQHGNSNYGNLHGLIKSLEQSIPRRVKYASRLIEIIDSMWEFSDILVDIRNFLVVDYFLLDVEVGEYVMVKKRPSRLKGVIDPSGANSLEGHIEIIVGQTAFFIEINQILAHTAEQGDSPGHDMLRQVHYAPRKHAMDNFSRILQKHIAVRFNVRGEFKLFSSYLLTLCAIPLVLGGGHVLLNQDFPANSTELWQLETFLLPLIIALVDSLEYLVIKWMQRNDVIDVQNAEAHRRKLVNGLMIVILMGIMQHSGVDTFYDRHKHIFCENDSFVFS